MPHVWDPEAFVYRDANSGDIVNEAQIESALQMSLRDSFEHAAVITAAIDNGDLHPSDAEMQIRDEIEAAYIRQFVLGKGGRDNMSASDWIIIGALLVPQFFYLRRFAKALRADAPEQRVITSGEIQRRLNMYMNSSRQAFSRGDTRNKCDHALPAHPGDGSTDCMSACCCRWERIDKVKDDRGNMIGCNCYWQLGPCQHCVHCPTRALQWSPLFIPISGELNVDFADRALFK